MEGYTEVFAWGGDHYGQLGLAGNQSGKTYCTPRFCSFNVIIRQIACGEEHSAFIAQNGYLYTMGSNADGRLGIGDQTIRQSSSPYLVEALVGHNAVAVNCGWGHTAAVLENGSVFTWGVGEFGALGNGSTESQWSPVKVKLPRGTQAHQVSCGSRHTAFIASDSHSHGKLYVCGAGEAGQLGTGRKESHLTPLHIPLKEELISVGCGVFHTALVTASGGVLTTGANSSGQLGLGHKKSVLVPTPVESLDSVQITKVACAHYSVALSVHGGLYVWGTGVFGEFLDPMRISSISTPIKDIETGGSFGAAVDIHGGVWTWGSNVRGELGVGDYESRVNPFPVRSLQGKQTKMVACGGDFAIALGGDIESSSISSLSYRQETDLEVKLDKSPRRLPTELATPRKGKTTRLPRSLSIEVALPYKGKTSRSPRRLPIEAASPHSKRGRTPPKRQAAPITRVPLKADSKRRLSKPQTSGSSSGLNELTKILEFMQQQQDQLRAEFKLEQESRRRLEQEMLQIHRPDSDSFGVVSRASSRAKERVSRCEATEMQDKTQDAEILRLKALLSEKDREISAHKEKVRTLEDQQVEGKGLDGKLKEVTDLLKREQTRRQIAEEEVQRVSLELRRKEEELTTLRLDSENLRKAYDSTRHLPSKSDGGEIRGLLREEVRVEWGEEGSAKTAARLTMLEEKLKKSESACAEADFARRRLEEEGQSMRHALHSAKLEISRLTKRAEQPYPDPSLDWPSSSTFTLDQYSVLGEDVADADLRSRRAFEDLEKNLKVKAREYKERTLHVLATPSPLRGSSASPENSFVVSPLPQRSMRYKLDFNINEGESKENSPYSQGVGIRTSNSASRLMETLSQDSSVQGDPVSPRLTKIHRQPRHEEETTPPTFRGQDSSGFKNSLGDISMKLQSLQKNKSLLESRMQDFERKLKIPRQMSRHAT
jgi:X-linked retinitis pigmentosa GTPase regulator